MSGVVFVALMILGVVVLAGDHPESDGTPAAILSFYEAETVRQMLAAMTLAAAAPFIVLFALSLSERLGGGGNNRSGLWERVLSAGGVLTAAAVVAGAWVHFALADGGDQSITPEAMQALNTLDGDLWLPVNSALGVLMLGAAGSLLSSRLLPRWLGWAALGLGIGLFVLFVNFFALILTLLWIVAVSVLLFRATERIADASTAAPRAVS